MKRIVLTNIYATVFLSLTFQAASITPNDYVRKIKCALPFWSNENSSTISYVGLITIENALENAKPLVRKLLELQKDPKVKGLIIHINCPGGVIGTSQAIFSQIKKFKITKPVIVIVENYCYSGAYYIASAADFIFALPSSELGEIGVVSVFKKHTDLKFDKDNISGNLGMHVYMTGHYKDLANPYIQLKEEHVDYILKKARKKYNQFIADVAEARNLSIADEKIWADGKAFVGTDALTIGLIDALGDFSDALDKMQELLVQRGINTSKLEVLEITINDTKN